MAAAFKDGRHHLYDFSDMGDLGVKSVIYYDAELKWNYGIGQKLPYTSEYEHISLNLAAIGPKSKQWKENSGTCGTNS